jgi:hypothetical protein
VKTASVTPAAPPRRRVDDLIELALEALPAMRLSDGSFCFQRCLGRAAPEGRSPRYTLMVELGLLNAHAAGYDVSISVDELDALAHRELAAGRLTPGDIGLMLWVDARRNAGRGGALADCLNNALDRGGGVAALVGMELGWIVTGLAHNVVARGSATGRRLLEASLDQLLVQNRTASGLFRHFGAPGWRRRFPNFATQIYSVLALAVVAGHGLDDRAFPAACAAADRLLATQLPDGGWPWLFDADRGSVVERYEVYCVHQDAMAPMGLLALWDISRDDRYLRAVAHGLNWVFGQNELGVDMVRREDGLVLRSIRRGPGADRIWLAAKTGASLAGRRSYHSVARFTRVNPTDRPYHFGWVLEAWCGREDVLARSLV